MTSSELEETLRGIDDPRFVEHVRMLLGALGANDAKISYGGRLVPGRELVDIYRGRRDGAQSRGRPTEALEALVDLFSTNSREAWRICGVGGAGIDGALFVSNSGRVGCFARKREDS